ncbi:MAG: MFS transporter [Chloroflexota bacterium]|nr:MFS transporter [Chloroflexota bacterium]
MDGSSQRAPQAPTDTEAAEPAESRVATFASLKNRNFRWFWLAMVAAFSGLMMQNLARGWLVYELTSSPFALGMVSAAWGGPVLLLSIFGGVVTDRVNKRNLLIVTQVATAVITAVVAVLILNGAIEVWHLVLAAALTGITFAFNAPGRQAMIPELVSGRELMNALALNSMGVNMTRVGAPAVAGVLVAAIGVAGVYFISVGLYIVAVAALFMVTVAPQGRGGSVKSLAADAAEGLTYIVRRPVIVSLLAVAFLTVLVGMPYMHMMPAFVVDVLHGGAADLGWLSASGGTGALAGALVIASLGDYRRKGRLMLLIAFGFGLLLVAFALSSNLAFALALIFGIGVTNNGYLVLNNTLIQSNVPNWVRGRVMSVYSMTFALPFLGALGAGAVAERLGVATVFWGSGAMLAVFVLGLAVLHRGLRRLE